MIRDFKSFNEDLSKDDENFIAIADQFYTDFSDIVYKVNGLKYNIRLYKQVNNYRINILINDYDTLNNSGYLDEIRSLLKEFSKEYGEEKLTFQFTLVVNRLRNSVLLFKKGDESFDNAELSRYLHTLKESLVEFKNSYDNINRLWLEDHNVGLDLNEILSDNYPFDLSFDEINIDDWFNSSIGNIDRKLGLE